MSLIFEETNRYAKQHFNKNEEYLKVHSRARCYDVKEVDGVYV